jgi:FkbM family methyltransferase
LACERAALSLGCQSGGSLGISAMTASEYVRRTLRAALPTSVFGTLSASADWVAALRRLPFSEARQLMDALEENDAGPMEELITLNATTLKHPFQLRPLYSDARSFIGTCIRSEYAPLLPEARPTYVVDAGAFTGDCSALMLTRFPDARLVALEPQPDAFRLAQRNLEPYTAAVVRHEALWSSEGTLFCDGQGMGASVSRDQGSVAVSCLSMERVMADAAFPRLDLFKCDIEGAEVDVFSNGSLAWLRRTACVLIELHNVEAVRVVRSACHDAGLRSLGQYRSTHVFQRCES